MDKYVDKIAVVTPVFNGQDSIEKSISSLLNQTFQKWVNIIVNDGSTDGTKEVLDKYLDDPRFIIIHLEKNVGRACARQFALDKVRSERFKYMCMLDADDVYYSDKLEWQYDYMERNLNLTLMSSSIGYINSQNHLKGVLETFSEEKSIKVGSYVDYIAVPHASSIIRVCDVKGVDFDKDFLLGQDQDFMIRLLIGKAYSFVPRISYLYNREDSFSVRKYRNSLKYSRMTKKKFNVGIEKAFLFSVVDFLKVSVVRALSLVQMQKLYLKKLGRAPRECEVLNHSKLLSKSL